VTAVLKDYFAYYERCRTHLSLEKDAPVSRPVEPPSLGHMIQIPKVGGLHHLIISTHAKLPDRKKTPKQSLENAERVVYSFVMRNFLFCGRVGRWSVGRNSYGVFDLYTLPPFQTTKQRIVLVDVRRHPLEGRRIFSLTMGQRCIISDTSSRPGGYCSGSKMQVSRRDFICSMAGAGAVALGVDVQPLVACCSAVMPGPYRTQTAIVLPRKSQCQAGQPRVLLEAAKQNSQLGLQFNSSFRASNTGQHQSREQHSPSISVPFVLI
jgi:hypothetical protein